MTEATTQDLGGDAMDHDHGANQNGGKPGGDPPEKPDPKKDRKKVSRIDMPIVKSCFQYCETLGFCSQHVAVWHFNHYIGIRGDLWIMSID